MSDYLDRWPLSMKIVWQFAALLVISVQFPMFVEDLCPQKPGKALHDYFQEWSSAMSYYTGHPVYMKLSKCLDVYDVYEPLPGEKFPLVYNAHPPFSVVMILPFVSPEHPGFPGYRRSLLQWNIASLIMFAVAVALIWWELKLRLSPWLYLPACAALLMYNPLRTQMSMGQLNCILLLLLTLVWWTERRKIPLAPGIFIGIATAIKLFPGLLLVWLLIRRRWLDLGCALATCACLGLLTWALLGTQTFVDYVQIVIPSLERYLPGWCNHSVFGFWNKLLVGGEHQYVTPLFYVPLAAKVLSYGCAFLLVAGWCWQTWRAQSLAAQDLVFGMAITTMMLVSPVTWDYSLLLMTLPLVLLLYHGKWNLKTGALFAVCWGTWWYFSYGVVWKFESLTGIDVYGTPFVVLSFLNLPFYGLLGVYWLHWYQLQQLDLAGPPDSAAAGNSAA